MTNEIVERLENMACDMVGNWDGELDSYSEQVLEAAAEITRLNAEIDALHAQIDHLKA